MITLKQRTGFRSGVYLTIALAFMCIQTNKLCAQNSNSQAPKFLQSRLQKLKQQQSTKSTDAVRKDATVAKNSPAVNERTYTFTGKGSWFTASNWKDNLVPPSLLKAGDHIIIEGSGACMINDAKPLLLPEGSSIEIKKSKELYVSIGNNFIVKGNLINNGKLTVISGVLPSNVSPNTSGNTGIIKTTRLSKIEERKQ